MLSEAYSQAQREAGHLNPMELLRQNEQWAFVDNTRKFIQLNPHLASRWKQSENPADDS